MSKSKRKLATQPAKKRTTPRHLDSMEVTMVTSELQNNQDIYEHLNRANLAEKLSDKLDIKGLNSGHVDRIAKTVGDYRGTPWSFNEVRHSSNPDSEALMELLVNLDSKHSKNGDNLYHYLRQIARRVNELVAIQNGLTPSSYKAEVNGKFHLHFLPTDPMHTDFKFIKMS